jgi:hypothetical protein
VGFVPSLKEIYYKYLSAFKQKADKQKAIQFYEYSI